MAWWQWIAVIVGIWSAASVVVATLIGIVIFGWRRGRQRSTRDEDHDSASQLQVPAARRSDVSTADVR